MILPLCSFISMKFERKYSEKKEHESNQKIIRFFYRYSLVYIEHLFIINKINKK